ncbi:hypothetical protein PHYPSEUDO_010863 [Phytophthora pseudosyringae]|uniref:Uncharacterized protein n=1 Tax=Phytophthora pseudosyringae TaxID=221518 RepID=A0A8T1VEK6_9STRA|nr:hypothetical protein PHYPSEUDO_010863 [Phytophthora pseudosyringae]
MAPPLVRTAENGKARVQLRGFERVYTAVDESPTKVAHVLVAKGPVRTLEHHLPTARRLLRVRSTEGDEEQAGGWKRHVQQEYERYEQFASFMEVWIDE